jgi:tetratricopeptide (TPR) repeat protein
VRAAVALASVPSESIEPSNRPTVQRAFTEYEAALAGQADDPHALADLGAYWTDRGEWPQAIRCFQRALRLDPHHVGALAEGAQALELSGRRDEALAWLEQARKDAPTNATVNLNLGLLLVRQGRMDEAENRLKDAWAADPTLAAVPYNLGILVATDPARQEEAIAWLRRAVALQPGEPRFTAALARWAGRKPYGSEAPDPHPKTPR